MFVLPTKLLSQPVNVDKYAAIIDTHCGLPLCKHSHEVEVYTSKGRLSFLLTNCISVNPPITYHDGDRLLILNAYTVYIVSLTGEHVVDCIDIHYLVMRVDKIPAGYLVCHEEGCLLWSHDLELEYWHVEDSRIQNAVWRDDELRFFYNEYTSILIDEKTGKKKCRAANDEFVQVAPSGETKKFPVQQETENKIFHFHPPKV